MKAQHGSIAKASAAAALTLVLSTSLAVAQGEPAPPAWLKEKPEPQVELFLSSLFANSASEGSFGLRGAFPSAGVSPSKAAWPASPSATWTSGWWTSRPSTT